MYLALCLVDVDQELIVASFLTGCGGSGEEKEELFFCVASVVFCVDPEIHGFSCDLNVSILTIDSSLPLCI